MSSVLFIVESFLSTMINQRYQISKLSNRWSCWRRVAHSSFSLQQLTILRKTIWNDLLLNDLNWIELKNAHFTMFFLLGKKFIGCSFQQGERHSFFVFASFFWFFCSSLCVYSLETVLRNIWEHFALTHRFLSLKMSDGWSWPSLIGTSISLEVFHLQHFNFRRCQMISIGNEIEDLCRTPNVEDFLNSIVYRRARRKGENVQWHLSSNQSGRTFRQEMKEKETNVDVYSLELMQRRTQWRN